MSTSNMPAQRASPVLESKRSDEAKNKDQAKRTDDELPLKPLAHRHNHHTTSS